MRGSILQAEACQILSLAKNPRWSVAIYKYCHTRLHLGFLAKLRIWQVPACFLSKSAGRLAGRQAGRSTGLSCMSPSIMSVPPIMSIPTSYVCPHLSFLSPPLMSVPTYYVCPYLLCLSIPIMSVPTRPPHQLEIRTLQD